MHSTDGSTFVPIAAKLGSSADAVRKLWGQAVEELAKHLESPQDSA
jgi:DNA-directed RNA polymerase specialized sigma24 family protein